MLPSLIVATSLLVAPQTAQPDPLTDLAAVSVVNSELGRLATTHAGEAKVQQLGARVWADFGAIADTLPEPQLDADERETLDRLSQLRGADFDDAFLAALQQSSEALQPALAAAEGQTGNPQLDAVVHLGNLTTRLYGNDARRVRGEYVPLVDDMPPGE
jgi:hypothetical protein